MFSIAAINDSDNGNEWHQPLAPTKEAQEFHLSQLYHDGLSRLQAKEYEKAREFLELVLKDPLVLNPEAGNSAKSGHLLQLRFLALKNLALVFVQQGSSYHENALDCYLQAVEIDGNDFVVWNQLGTLACSMGSLGVARWAFEQGLICSPNNWNCMEKLLEVLIAIGDEVSCLSVSELILTHWPSHSRALHVKSTIEDPETVPFAPRSIDKLEPKHARLTFPEKRKALVEDLVMPSPKRVKKNIEIQLSEASWMALVSELLGILYPLSTPDEQMPGDLRLTVRLPSCSANSTSSDKTRGPTGIPVGSDVDFGDGIPVKDKEGYEVQPQERRSSRLERLRSRKPEKEEYGMSTKDLSKIVKQFLVPYIVDGVSTMNSEQATEVSSSENSNLLVPESADVADFVRNTSENFGAYHFCELLLEKIASIGILHNDSIVKILELEKLIRPWGHRRTKECSLFLAELYFDVGSASLEESAACSFTSEASYHLCKVIESAALDYPSNIAGVEAKSSCSGIDICAQHVMDKSSFLSSNNSFWIRFFWLSSHLSRVEGDKERVQRELSIALSLFLDKEVMTSHPGSISIHHCKGIKNLSMDSILYEMHLIEIDSLLKKSVREMFEKNMHKECISILAPLVLSAKIVCVDFCHDGVNEGKGFQSVELTALDVLIKSCELSSPMDIDTFLSSHKRKLQIVLAGAGFPVGSEDICSIGSFSTSQVDQSTWKYRISLVAEAVKAISLSASKIKCATNSAESSKIIPVTVIGGIQSLLLAFMCRIANLFLAKRITCSGTQESVQPAEQGYFIDASVAFCKLQHLNHSVPIKSQVELIVAIHDMLAEFGICCARGDGGEEQEGTFLKLGIKHLLTLDMKLKSSIKSVNEKQDIDCSTSKENDSKMSEQLEKGPSESSIVESSSCSPVEKIRVPFSLDRLETSCAITGIESSETVERGEMFTEDEREELELIIDNALDQCFYCLYGLNLRLDSSYEEDLVKHKNTTQGDYQTKEQCADVFQYILPYAKTSTRSGLVKLRRVLRAIHKHFPQPPDDILSKNAIDKFLDDSELSEDKLSEHAGSAIFLDTMMKAIFPENESIKPGLSVEKCNSDPYIEVHRHLYYVMAQSEEMSASDKWAGFVLTKEGEDFVQQNANLFKYDLLYNPMRFESWERLARIYDEEVDLLLNDGSKQINVFGWRKSCTLTQRVEASRRRSRRCLLMTLALAKSTLQQAEIHQLLALVYYDEVQNGVPFYDQRLILPLKDGTWTTFCQNALSHFKRAFNLKEDWSHAFYIGKLSEKLGHPHDTSLSYYAQAVALNPAAVDPFYRLHASRLKILSKSRKQDEDALKVVAVYSFAESTKETVNNILGGVFSKSSDSTVHHGYGTSSDLVSKSTRIENVRTLLYEDCLSALYNCVEGDLKHFHKARYMISQGLYWRGGPGDTERGKEELSFCFKSSRSSFTINMWEIDSTVKKGKRKNAGPSGNRRCLEVNSAESSRKFITCIRKYILFYLKLLEETGDVSTLERAHISLRADKRFSLCLEDLVPVAIGRYIKALISCINGPNIENAEQFLEKLFNLFLDQTNLWKEICSLPELKISELTEDCLFSYLCRYIQLLEMQVKVETLEVINEKIRKRLKNPKLSNSHCAKLYRHISAAWCRSLIINMASITPLHSKVSTNKHGSSSFSGVVGESEHLLCVDLQPEELWSSAYEDSKHLKNLETKWSRLLSKIKNVIIKRVSDEEDFETATLLLTSAYNFYKDTSCALLPSGINLYTVPPQLTTETYIQSGIDGIDIIDTNTSRKLLLWAYSLLHGHYTNIPHIIKYCEDCTKSKMRKGTGSTSSTPNTPPQASTPVEPGGNKEGTSSALSQPERRREEKCSSTQQDNRMQN